MIVKIALHELRLLLRSPFAWLAAGLLQILFGWLFLSAVDNYLTLQASAAAQSTMSMSAYLVVHFLAPASVVFMVATPLLCMHLIAGEKQSTRYNLLLSLPITAQQLVLGKFFGAIIFQFMIVALGGALIALLAMNINLDTSHLLTAGFGLLLYIAAISALTIFYSSAVKHPILAAFLSFITVALLWIATATSANGFLLVAAPSAHLHSFMQGLLDSRDLTYFIASIGSLLALGIWRFDAQRVRSAW